MATSDEIKDLMIETAKFQVATMNAGIAFWKQWIDTASEFSNAASEQLIKSANNEISKEEAGSKITDISRQALREMTKLPQIALDHFNREIENISDLKKKKAGRSAKAKS